RLRLGKHYLGGLPAHRDHAVRSGAGEAGASAPCRDPSSLRPSASLPRIAFSSCSKPPCSIEQCMPHSLGAFVSHHQRPARSSSPSPIARVQGAQPIEVKPFAYSPCTGTSFSRRYAHTSRFVHSAIGLSFTIAPWSWSISTL